MNAITSDRRVATVGCCHTLHVARCTLPGQRLEGRGQIKRLQHIVPGQSAVAKNTSPALALALAHARYVAKKRCGHKCSARNGRVHNLCAQFVAVAFKCSKSSQNSLPHPLQPLPELVSLATLFCGNS